MIEKTIKRKDCRRNAERLKDTGYVSKNIVVDAKYREKYSIPNYSELCAMADRDDIQAYKITAEESGISTYWFKRDEMENLWIEPIVTEMPDNLISNIKHQRSESRQQELPLELTVKIDDRAIEEAKNRCIQEIESKANELFDLTQRINKEPRENIEIYCPYTIGAVQSIWNDCIAAIQRESNLNITVKYAEKKAKLDASKLDDSHWDIKSHDINI